MKGFLPEWKVYLWKKLLLGDYAPERAFHVADFVFFNEEARRQMFFDDAQRDISRLKAMEARAKQGMDISDLDMGSALPSQDRWYSFDPKQVFVALAELGMSESAPVKLESVRVGKNFTQQYRAQRQTYLENQEKKRLGSLPSGRPGSYVAPKIDDRFTDPWCGLPKGIYEKIEAEEDIHFAELANLARMNRNEGLVDRITFKISVDKGGLKSRLELYVRNFMDDDLVSPEGARFFDATSQSKKILFALDKISKKFGPKNRPITFEEISVFGGWANRDENKFRFLETLLALEVGGYITIKEIRGKEVILSILRSEWSYVDETVSAVPPNIEEKPAKKFPHKLPSGTTWENFTMKFIDDETLMVDVAGKREEIRFSDMGLEDRRSKKPDSQWAFLKILARHNGEITWDTPVASENLKTSKTRLTKTLQSYFAIDYDPFYPYKTGRSFKMKAVIIPLVKDGPEAERLSVSDEIENIFRDFSESE